MSKEVHFLPDDVKITVEDDENLLAAAATAGVYIHAYCGGDGVCGKCKCKIEEGEGIMSLARGFIYAGVPSIVMTLWEVEDKSGADIMTLFYQKLKKGMPKDIALQQAKLDYLKTATQLRSHPYFWLAYVDIGNTFVEILLVEGICYIVGFTLLLFGFHGLFALDKLRLAENKIKRQDNLYQSLFDSANDAIFLMKGE